MSSYREFTSQQLSNIGVSGGSTTTQKAFQNVTQSGISTVTHDADASSTRIVQVVEFTAGDTGLVNTSLDFDLLDEGDFIQEDSVSGTDFIDGSVILYNNSTLTSGTETILGNSVSSIWNTEVYGVGGVFTSDGILTRMTTMSLGNASPGDWFKIGIVSSSHIVRSQVEVQGQNTGTSLDFTGLSLQGFAGDGIIIQHEEGLVGYSGNTGSSNGYYFYGWPSNGQDISTNQSPNGWEGTVYINYTYNDYTTTKPYYITTSDSNQINLSSIAEINSVAVTKTEPADTLIKSLVSFDDRTTWKAYRGEIRMVVDIGVEGTYDTGNVAAPHVIKESPTSYKMWYAGHDGTNWRIIYCTSTNGTTWTNHQMIVDKGSQGSYDANHAYAPCVIKESSASYKMWYAGHDGTNWRIIYCTSTNGTTWTNHQMIVDKGSQGSYDANHAYAPCVIKESSASYKMWYAGHDGTNYRIIYCTSTNGTTWTNHQMVVDIEDEGTYDTVHAYMPYVIKESETSYKMWYGGYDGTNYRIIYCTSTNGTTWTNHQMVVDKGSEETYDTLHVFAPYVTKESNTSYKMWYSGHDGDATGRTIYAESQNGTTRTSSFSETVNFSDITVSGGFVSPMVDSIQNITTTSGMTYLDFAFDLGTTDSGTTPEIDQITINYDEEGAYALSNMNDDYTILHHSSTQTKVTKDSVGTENIKVNVII